MTLDAEQIDIIIYDSSVNSYKIHVARAKRIMDRAIADYREAAETLDAMEHKLAHMRDAYARRCV